MSSKHIAGQWYQAGGAFRVLCVRSDLTNNPARFVRLVAYANPIIVNELEIPHPITHLPDCDSWKWKPEDAMVENAD